MQYFGSACTCASLLLGCAMLTGMAHAQAVTHTVDFDNYSGGGAFGSGQPVTNEYADIGLQVEARRNGAIAAPTTFDSGLPTRRNYLSNIISNGVVADFIAFNFTAPVSDISLLVNTGLPGFGVELTYYDAGGNLMHTEEIYGLDITYASALEGVAVVQARQLTNGNQFFLDDLIYVIPSAVSTEEEIAEFVASMGMAGRIVVINASQRAGQHGGNSLATRDLLTLTDLVGRQSGVIVRQNGNSFGAVTGGVYTWAEITGFWADNEDADRSITGSGFQIGADVELNPNVVIGLSVGAHSLNASTDTFEQEGTLVTLQPYLAYRSGAWSGALTFSYGQGEFDQTSINGSGTGEVVVRSISYSGGYDISLESGMVVTPTFGVVHGVEEFEAVSGTLAGNWSEEMTFTQASVGVEFSQAFASGDGFFGLHADWLESSSDNSLVTERLGDDEWTGRLEFGFATQLDMGIDLNTSVEIAGLGGDLRQASGGLRIAFNF